MLRLEPMSTTTRLLVLGVVRLFQPVHGYEVRRELITWHASEWASVKPGSIYNALKTTWKRLRAAAKVDDFRFHDKRHDLATKLLRKTGNLKLVQTALNHRNIKTTLKYAHVLDDEVAAGLQQVQKSRRSVRKVG